MKQNHLLQSYYRKFEAEHHQKRMILSQIILMASILAAHDVFKVGPGRIALFVNSYIDWKEKIADCLQDDVGDSRRKHGDGDRDFLKTRHDLATVLKPIFGPAQWSKYRELFPMLIDFWLWEDTP